MATIMTLQFKFRLLHLILHLFWTIQNNNLLSLLANQYNCTSCYLHLILIITIIISIKHTALHKPWISTD